MTAQAPPVNRADGNRRSSTRGYALDGKPGPPQHAGTAPKGQGSEITPWSKISSGRRMPSVRRGESPREHRNHAKITPSRSDCSTTGATTAQTPAASISTGGGTPRSIFLVSTRRPSATVTRPISGTLGRAADGSPIYLRKPGLDACRPDKDIPPQPAPR